MGQNYEYAIKTLKMWQNKFNFEFLKTVKDTCGGLLSLVNLQTSAKLPTFFATLLLAVAVEKSSVESEINIK